METAAMIAAITTKMNSMTDSEFITFFRGAIIRQLSTMPDTQLQMIMTNLGIS